MSDDIDSTFFVSQFSKTSQGLTTLAEAARALLDALKDARRAGARKLDADEHEAAQVFADRLLRAANVSAVMTPGTPHALGPMRRWLTFTLYPAVRENSVSPVMVARLDGIVSRLEAIAAVERARAETAPAAEPSGADSSTEEKIRLAVIKRLEGKSVRQIVAEVGISKPTLYRYPEFARAAAMVREQGKAERLMRRRKNSGMR